MPAPLATEIRRLTHDLSNALEILVQTSYLLSLAELKEPAAEWLKMLEGGVTRAIDLNAQLRNFVPRSLAPVSRAGRSSIASAHSQTIHRKERGRGIRRSAWDRAHFPSRGAYPIPGGGSDRYAPTFSFGARTRLAAGAGVAASAAAASERPSFGSAALASPAGTFALLASRCSFSARAASIFSSLAPAERASASPSPAPCPARRRYPSRPRPLETP